MRSLNSFLIKPSDDPWISSDEYTRLGKFIVSAIPVAPFVALPFMAVCHLAIQVFENGDTTHLVDPRSVVCNKIDNAARLAGLTTAQAYADSHGGPSAVCYVEGPTQDGRVWYTVGS